MLFEETVIMIKKSTKLYPLFLNYTQHSWFYCDAFDMSYYLVIFFVPFDSWFLTDVTVDNVHL